MEGWKVGRMEGWKVGRLEGWKDGRMVARVPSFFHPSNLPSFPSHSFPASFWLEAGNFNAKASHL